MRVLLTAPGYPPELRGGTEHCVQALARALVRAGLEVVVVAGSDRWQDGSGMREDVDRFDGGALRVLRLQRTDAFYGHWQKGLSPALGRAFQELVRSIAPDVVHVHHWIRLTSDLVRRVALAGRPAVVTLHDLWSTCLIYFRVRPDLQRYCDARLAADPCLGCARLLLPHADWSSPAEELAALEGRTRVIARELRLARVVFALGADQAAVLREHGPAPEVPIRLLPPARELQLAPRRLHAGPRELGRLVLGAWGGLHPLKGTDRLLDALVRLRGLAIELHLAGFEADRAFVASLRERARGLDVHFHGPFEDGALATHPVGAVHAFVSGTLARETWGLAADEAVALGLPLVLPRFGAFRERFTDGGGVLFYETGDVGSLARALERLAREDGLWQSLCARLPPLRSVLPSPEDIAARSLRAYAEALGAGAPAVEPLAPREDERVQAELEQWDVRFARSTEPRA